MRNKNLLIYGGVVLAVPLLIWGGLYYVKHHSAPAAPRENFEAAMRAMKAQANNPQKDLFSGKKIDELKTVLSEKGNWPQKASVLQAGVVFFDSNPKAVWSAAEYSGLAETLLSHLEFAGHEPEQKKAQVLGFHLLKRILPQAEDPKVHSHLDAEVARQDCKKDTYSCVNYLDLASVMVPVSDKTIKKIEQCVVGSDLGLAQSCLSIVEQIREAERSKALVQYTVEHYPQMKDPLKPFAARLIFARHGVAPVKAQELLAYAARSNQQTWQDVFIYGVAELDAKETYRSRLAELGEKAVSPTVRQRAKSLVH